MGQKVHPLGFRVGITKKHQSQWFARFNKHKYAQSVLEDRMLRQTLTNLFPQLLNPVLKNITVKGNIVNKMTNRVIKDTTIKIENIVLSSSLTTTISILTLTILLFILSPQE